MLTLTYLCPPVNGKESKHHLKLVLAWLARRCETHSYIWFCEFTRSGAVHYHILTTCIPTDDMRRDLALYWVDLSSQGEGRYCSLRDRRVREVRDSIISSVEHYKVWEMIKNKDGAKRYIAKYASKPHQKHVPMWYQDVGRFWGASRDVAKHRYQPKMYLCSENELMEILRAAGHPVGDWDIIPKYLWGCKPEWFDGFERVTDASNTIS